VGLIYSIRHVVELKTYRYRLINSEFDSITLLFIFFRSFIIVIELVICFIVRKKIERILVFFDLMPNISHF